jgi:DNA-binding response OmpR family regulator
MTEARRLRVLIVDDEPDMLALLQAVLVMRDWEVIGRASDGETAVRIAGDITPDLVIVDYMMPGLNGIETAERIKATRPASEVLLFSALDLENEAAAHPAVDRFLRKGDMNALQRVLSEIRKGHGLDG